MGNCSIKQSEGKSKMKEYKERGSVTIEATISLTAFLFLFMMVYSLITICRAQAQIGTALNNTAKEISQYSYIYGLTGLDESFKELSESASGTKDGLNGFVDKVSESYDAIQNLGASASGVKNVDVTDYEAMSNQWNSIGEAAKDVKDSSSEVASDIKSAIDSLVDNPKGVMFGLARLFATEAIDVATSKLIAEPVSRALVKKHLKRSDTDDANAYLKSMGVVAETTGKNAYINSLDFSRSTIFADGSNDIVLIVTYKIEALPLLPINYEFIITQSSATMGWLRGDEKTPEPISKK